MNKISPILITTHHPVIRHGKDIGKMTLTFYNNRVNSPHSNPRSFRTYHKDVAGDVMFVLEVREMMETLSKTYDRLLN